MKMFLNKLVLCNDMNIAKEIKDINRLRQIIDVLLQQGFGYFIAGDMRSSQKTK